MDADRRRGHIVAIGLPALAIVSLTSAVAQPGGGPTSPQRALFDQYCVTCHNQRARTAGLVLDTIAVDNVAGGAPTWEKVVRKIRTGAMPPPSMPRPGKTTLDAFASWLAPLRRPVKQETSKEATDSNSIIYRLLDPNLSESDQIRIRTHHRPVLGPSREVRSTFRLVQVPDPPC